MAGVIAPPVHKSAPSQGRTCRTCAYLGCKRPGSPDELGEFSRIRRDRAREWGEDSPEYSGLGCHKKLLSSEDVWRGLSTTGCSEWRPYRGGWTPQFAYQEERSGVRRYQIIAGVVAAVLLLAVALFVLMK
jgi:hypothetical protein